MGGLWPLLEGASTFKREKNYNYQFFCIFSLSTCCSRQTIYKNYGIGNFYNLSLDWFLVFNLVQITFLRPQFNLVYALWYLAYHFRQKFAKIMVSAIYLILDDFGFFFGWNDLSEAAMKFFSSKYIPFDTQHVSVPQKLGKTLVQLIFYVVNFYITQWQSTYVQNMQN